MNNKMNYLLILCMLATITILRGCDDNGGVSCTFEGEFNSLIIPGETGRVNGAIGYDVLEHTATCNWIDGACKPSTVGKEYTKWIPKFIQKATELINSNLAIGTYNQLSSVKIKTITISCYNRQRTCDITNNQCTNLRTTG